MDSASKTDAPAAQKTDKAGRSSPLNNFIAGISAGISAALVLHPLDALRTRIQLNEGIPSFAKIQYKGILRGISSSIVASSASWSIYFALYAPLKSAFMPNMNHTLTHLLSASVAGGITALMTNPLWLVRTRILSFPPTYPNLLVGLRSILKTDGFSGLYRGITPALLSVSHGAIQFTVYDDLKLHFSEPTTMNYIVLAATSKTAAMIATYPFQLIKARMQAHPANLSHAYPSFLASIATIYRNEGLYGFYKGISLNLIRVLPATCITFVVYETCMSQLISK